MHPLIPKGESPSNSSTSRETNGTYALDLVLLGVNESKNGDDHFRGLYVVFVIEYVSGEIEAVQ